jgi:hypothetical protein
MNTERRTVSDDTQGFIECLEELDKVYHLTSNALSTMYGDVTAEHMMGGDFIDKFNDFKDVIAELMTASILNKMGELDKHEI